ncbi:hypothetical protein ATZ33_11795 [Enterococcus silesiacus]|nr:hypothetical protein [Enterococcus silesiacus]ALS02042.1 hypothetical protein ATZ33_11795 [Enterococcus silesiacus]
MSDNLNEQNKIEQLCLNAVRNSLTKEMCFGVSDNEYEQLKIWLGSAVPNENSNAFPDFIFEGGFIEHFAVTSSSENRKGSKHKAEMTRFEKGNFDKFSKAINEKEKGETVKHFSNKTYAGHSHENIVNSIKKNWNKHVDSLEKYEGIKEHGIFLIEYADTFAMETAEIIGNQISEVYDSYRMNTDKELLEWLYNYKEKIEYIILFNVSSLEIIKVNQIMNFIDGVPKGLYVGMPTIVSDRYIGFNV